MTSATRALVISAALSSAVGFVPAPSSVGYGGMTRARAPCHGALRLPVARGRLGAVGHMRRAALLQTAEDAAQWSGVEYEHAPAQAAVPEFGLGEVPVQTFFPQPDRIIAIGDIHGDDGALIACLRMAECIDSEGNWCGGTTNVVQIGDILDRGDEERGCMDRLFDLKRQAAAAGGAVHVLMGNHEVMNVDWDFDYVGLNGFDGWESREQPHTNVASGTFLGNVFGSFTQGLQMGGVPRILKDRAKAFTAGTGFAALALSEMPLAIQLGDTVCVHGGLELKHIDMDLHRINVETSEWLRGAGPRPPLIDDDDSPIWNRAFSAPADRPLKPHNARKLEYVLHAMGARRMIVGHTPQVISPNGKPAQMLTWCSGIYLLLYARVTAAAVGAKQIVRNRATYLGIRADARWRYTSEERK